MNLISLILTSLFTLVELNCENLFDTRHDPHKQDTEFLPDGSRHWTPSRYWRKLNRVGQTILACGGEGAGWRLPDLVALCEVENDTVMRDLTRRSLLRTARYEYVMTSSPDERGIDVALLYAPSRFALLRHGALAVEPLPGMRPTRDILYAVGLTPDRDTLHVFVVHAPSRSGGERATRPYRLHVARRLAGAADSIRALSPQARIVVAGDFNDYADSPSLRLLDGCRLADVSAGARGTHGAQGTYRYRGQWGSLDHVLASPSASACLQDCFVMDAPFLLTEDAAYGGVRPRRTFQGPRYEDGFSDHLPLVARFRF